MSYRLLTYRADMGPRSGLAVDGQIYDVAENLGRPEFVTTRAILDDWQAVAPLLDVAALEKRLPGPLLQEAALLPPVAYPGAIYCAGANYQNHVDNMARRLNIATEPDPHELGLNPWHFIKSSWCAVGDKADVELDSNFLDWEAELAVVIGRVARRVGVDDVFDYVAGYTIGNDLSAREIANPQALRIRTLVNEVVKQDSDTGEMLFTIAEQIAHLSSRITLHPGDVILTGTPAGVGAETGECLKKGDVVRVEIEQIGHLTTQIV